jgi:acetolactate synthase-1/2/3 large subunit
MNELALQSLACLRAHGVKRVYTVPCDLIWLLQSIEEAPDLQLLSVRHESSAAFMADADARLAGTPAIIVVGRSVGLANASNGIETARDASTPMVVVVLDTDRSRPHLECFQRLDIATFCRPISKQVLVLDSVDDFPQALDSALRISTNGRPGPVVIAVPPNRANRVAVPYVPSVHSPQPALPPLELADAALQKIVKARRPVIIAGGGTKNHREALIRFAERFQLGVYVSFRRQDHFPNDHPLFLGHLGMYVPRETRDALFAADLVVVLGSKLSQMTSQNFRLPKAGSEVIQVDIDPARIGVFRPASIAIPYDIGHTLEVWLQSNIESSSRDWAADHQKFIASTEIPADRGQQGVDPAQVIQAMIDTLPADSIIASEAGGYATFFHYHWLFRHPHTQVACPIGTMGYGVPAAIAAKLAHPSKVVASLVGDGGFLMNGQEIETAVRYRLPLIVIVFNNRCLSGGGYLEFGRFAEVSDVDFAGYASAFGARGITVRRTDELRGALAEALGTDGVTVIDVKTDPKITQP